MEPRRGACLMLLQLLLLPAVRPLCPEPCDCQQQRHVVCTNRGLRAVPHPPAAAQDVLTYSLGGNFIANVSAADFQRLVGLQRLDLQYNRIRWLQPAAFERLGRLEELYLGNNLLAALPPGALGGLARLRILYVNANQLRRLSAAAFTGLGSLVKLRLDGNALGALGEAGFAGLPNLLYLHLESNRIRWLGRGAFTGLAKLRFLDLSGNPQRALRQPAAFAPLRSLHTLLLGSNRLQRLGGAPFRHLPGLATLSLSGNRLVHLEKVLGRRRRKAAPVHVRHVYSTRRPLRSTGTGVSADFSGFQAPRPGRGAAAAACALSEADLMDFPCERFLDSGGGVGARHGDEHLLQRFAD
ncbi:PREDICTED: TLR4 interactor with leucine rich repeats [Gavialis gangeticus]|uniref:TLR4 interactor with leucine rich repeats n=1 Tax=Gavialis gangeticus TaxID=94835 RepID=UPI00092E8589|nr:PREDICTED: TLR4 interactor with leucine rich repeats [Gavialis gangeticus]